jgi:hypothetical protein
MNAAEFQAKFAEREGLSEEQQLLVAQVVELLTQADRLQAQVDKDGSMLRGARGAHVVNPLIPEIRRLRETAARLVRDADLDPPAETPAQRQARRAAEARHHGDGISQTRQRAAAIDPAKKRRAAMFAGSNNGA